MCGKGSTKEQNNNHSSFCTWWQHPVKCVVLGPLNSEKSSVSFLFWRISANWMKSGKVWEKPSILVWFWFCPRKICNRRNYNKSKIIVKTKRKTSAKSETIDFQSADNGKKDRLKKNRLQHRIAGLKIRVKT